MSGPQSIGTVVSGDVTLFYRHFGTPGAAPVLILHGANYFDSADWIEVGAALARGREVVALDQRGFGESTWSSSRNYSNDANMEDMLALLDHLGWQRAVIMGHSRGGFFATLFAARFPERTAGLVLVDYGPGAGPPPGAQRINTTPTVYPTIEALQDTLSRDKNTPPGSLAHARLESFIKHIEDGIILSKRDPDFMNTEPLGAVGWTPKHAPTDMWQELAAVRAPIQILRGTKSNRLPAEAVARVQRELANADLVDIDSGHDMAAVASEALTTAVSRFLTARVQATAKR